MILICPSCSARYLIASDAITATGRDVRCGKCGHSWHQDPVRDSLDELRDATAQPSEKLDIPPSVLPQTENPTETVQEGVSIELPSSSQNIKTTKFIGGIISGFALFSILFVTIVLLRSQILSIFPEFKPVFIIMGLEQAGTENTFILDNVEAKLEGQRLYIDAKLINLSSSTMEIKPITVEILDNRKKIIANYSAHLHEKTLDGEKDMVLKLNFENIPDSGREVRLVFGKKTGSEVTIGEAASDNTPSHSEAGSDH